ncbi:unnamed protein product [Rodentolepis nana]|uniref:AH domain-containing protein n=1 Tax=Rodentolepis nana TaxID=102285 RepID=A0A0R3TMW9_RODNA|nr:unnamed protein product [Rodentolepis nana]
MSVSSGNSVNAVYPSLQNESHSTGASSIKNSKNLGNNGSLDLPGKIENFKAWSSTAMKCTKQAIEEKLGTTSPTRDPEMDGKIDEVKRIQARYQEISSTVKKMITHMNAITALEQSLSSQLTVASQHQPELIHEFAQNAEVQRVVAMSTNSYIGKFGSFRQCLFLLKIDHPLHINCAV